MAKDQSSTLSREASERTPSLMMIDEGGDNDLVDWIADIVNKVTWV